MCTWTRATPREFGGRSAPRFKRSTTRTHPPFPTKSFTGTWSSLGRGYPASAAVHAAAMPPRNAYNLVLHKHGHMLYNGVQQTVSAHLQEAAGEVISASDEALLESLANAWREHKVTMVMIRDILMYMVRPRRAMCARSGAGPALLPHMPRRPASGARGGGCGVGESRPSRAPCACLPPGSHIRPFTQEAAGVRHGPRYVSLRCTLPQGRFAPRPARDPSCHRAGATGRARRPRPPPRPARHVRRARHQLQGRVREQLRDPVSRGDGAVLPTRGGCLHCLQHVPRLPAQGGGKDRRRAGATAPASSPASR